MVARLFSIEDDEVLKELYSIKTNKELVDIFNGQFSQKQLKNRAKSLKLNKDENTWMKSKQTKSGAWDDWEKEIIKRHYALNGLEKVKELLPSRSKSSIIHKASRLGISVDYSIRNFANGPKSHSDETKIKMSKSHLGTKFSDIHLENLRNSHPRGDKHPLWRGGRSFKPYGPEFDIKLKHDVKKRDHYQCKLCNKKPSWNFLIIHHIDYDKSNNSIKNLITLCKACHVYHHLNITEDKRIEEQKFFIALLAKQDSELMNSNIHLATP